MSYSLNDQKRAMNLGVAYVKPRYKPKVVPAERLASQYRGFRYSREGPGMYKEPIGPQPYWEDAVDWEAFQETPPPGGTPIFPESTPTTGPIRTMGTQTSEPVRTTGTQTVGHVQPTERIPTTLPGATRIPTTTQKETPIPDVFKTPPQSPKGETFEFYDRYPPWHGGDVSPPVTPVIEEMSEEGGGLPTPSPPKRKKKSTKLVQPEQLSLGMEEEKKEEKKEEKEEEKKTTASSLPPSSAGVKLSHEEVDDLHKNVTKNLMSLTGTIETYIGGYNKSNLKKIADGFMEGKPASLSIESTLNTVLNQVIKTKQSLEKAVQSESNKNKIKELSELEGQLRKLHQHTRNVMKQVKKKKSKK